MRQPYRQCEPLAMRCRLRQARRIESQKEKERGHVDNRSHNGRSSKHRAWIVKRGERKCRQKLPCNDLWTKPTKGILTYLGPRKFTVEPISESVPDILEWCGEPPASNEKQRNNTEQIRIVCLLSV
jgi:hypothetical protein